MYCMVKTFECWCIPVSHSLFKYDYIFTECATSSTALGIVYPREIGGCPNSAQYLVDVHVCLLIPNAQDSGVVFHIYKQLLLTRKTSVTTFLKQEGIKSLNWDFQIQDIVFEPFLFFAQTITIAYTLTKPAMRPSYIYGGAGKLFSTLYTEQASRGQGDSRQW